ncbi:HAMP domain-containing protein [Bradyrhizobium erythrophlei]|nr:HAMP domain-containing protein [Bradyrhizobium erythrophlei]SIO67802.1 HAMP domain-containing protein [Bradyrhizobium erythrophlei]
MWQPHSVRSQLASVFVFFFLLAGTLGLFSISQLSSFNRLSANVAEVWLPTTRTLGDLNNFTSDFRAIEGSYLLSSEPPEIVATEKEMEELDRLIAQAERSFEQVRHDATEDDLYAKFKDRWNDYRKIVNQMLDFSRSNRKAEAIAIHRGSSRAAYNAVSDSLNELTDRAVANSRVASDRLASAYRRAFWLIGLAIVIAGLMVAGALIYIGSVISKPLLDLARRMHHLAANDTSIDFPGIERRDEIGEMARAAVVFRSNAIELMESQRALAEQASILKEQLEHEQRLALLQRNFVTMASHEFRTPLTNIDGHARRLIKMKNRLQPDDIDERAGRIRGSVLRLTHLIDNLLNSSRLIEGGPVLLLDVTDIDIAVLLREVCQLHREIAQGAPIVERFAAKPLQMRGDPKLLFQLFSNLLSNAIKYSPGDKPVEVDASIASDEIVVSVADQGIGVPVGDVDRLFDRYHRGSNVSGIVGTGVGLHLVKMVAELHGGRVQVESKEGKGSRFTVWLPVKSGSEFGQLDHRSAGAPDETTLVETRPG